MIPHPYDLAMLRRLRDERGCSIATLARRNLCDEKTIKAWLAEDARRRLSAARRDAGAKAFRPIVAGEQLDIISALEEAA